jgi:hypothetical protein
MAPFFKETTRFFDLGTVEKLSPENEHIMDKGKKDKSCVIAKIESDDVALVKTNIQKSLIVGKSKEWFTFIPEAKIEISPERPFKLLKKSAMVEDAKGKNKVIIWNPYKG